MKNFCSAVIPAKAGIQWLQGLKDPRLRGDDGKLAFFDTLAGGNPGGAGEEIATSQNGSQQP